jgi:hypothetical protein
MRYDYTKLWLATSIAWVSHQGQGFWLDILLGIIGAFVGGYLCVTAPTMTASKAAPSATDETFTRRCTTLVMKLLPFLEAERLASNRVEPRSEFGLIYISRDEEARPMELRANTNPGFAQKSARTCGLKPEPSAFR